MGNTFIKVNLNLEGEILQRKALKPMSVAQD